MIFFFEIPEIKDNVNIEQLAKPEAKADQQAQQYLNHVDSLRNQYKNVMTKEKIIEIMKLNDGILNYKKIFDDYLKTNVEVLALVGFRQYNVPSFKYKTFISKNIQEYTTNQNSNQEACAAEIMMARYSYAFSFQLDAFPHLNYVLQNIHNTFNLTQEYKEMNKFIAELDTAIETFKTGIQPIERLYNVINDVLYFLVQRQQFLIPEFKQTVFYSVKLILETSVNSLYAEKLRLQKDFKGLSQICRASFTKLTQAHSRFLEIKQEIRDDIMVFLESALLFWKGYGLWALLNLHQQDIEYDRFKAKSFTQLSYEVTEISKYIKEQLLPQYNGLKLDTDYFDYGYGILKQLVLPQCERCLAVHNLQRHNEVIVLTPDQIYAQVEPKDDFVLAQK
ncbi:hypothetical protein TTHERM_01079090 (macronuclear) [Tetrahymena thermophila SB210]|uniref:Uncharacterized protein n=1 Tax=Tetrahymena thermophila (strain SB210) TaxID=312017 RepID=Q24CE2_TETTS|nr:hypothetical protein TTHERM_01079090 [Tetrahymena thermophila SB210]EAS05432.2 hypothetical protein TTHERM_01079090 [Tetrahymena thermophila SB210]|eukprot:XP_001025677.2 hypothetical protein TTHERM_01079090 [Tetrahymena thermophila SB210]